MLLTQKQINAIYDEAKGQLHKTDPLPILQALNLNVIVYSIPSIIFVVEPSQRPLFLLLASF